MQQLPPPGDFTWRRRTLRITVAGAIAMLAACRNNDRPVVTEVTTARDAVEVSPDSSWNRFEADVVVTKEGAPMLTAKDRRVTMGAAFRLVRRRDAQGRWTTEHTFADFLPRTKGDAPLPTRVARIVSAPGREPVFYDATGREIRLPATAPLPAEMRRSAGASFPLAKTVAAMSASADTSSGWADRFMVTAAVARRGREHLTKDIGAATRLGASRVRFTQRRGEMSVELDVDEKRGTVDVTRLLVGGKKRQEIAREYAARADGSLLLMRERVTRFNEQGIALPGSVVTTYRNVRFLEAR